MKISFLKQLALAWLLLIFGLQLSAQDPFFIHFHSNAAAHNPSLVGYSGALSFSAKYKTQWNADGIEAFETVYLALEESLPCSTFDYGLSFQYDKEGPGFFRTYDLGFKFAGTIPIEMGNALNNIRLGASFQWSRKRVDFSNFIFSDQLDAKYGFTDVDGNPLSTSFNFPEENQSLTFFTPSVGISHRLLFDQTNKKSPSIMYGLSLHNSYTLGGDLFGNVESVLQNTARIPKRWTAFFQAEIIPYSSANTFVMIRPMVMYQKQSQLEYWEVGSRIALNRLIGIGMFYHFNKRAEAGHNTSWFSFLVELGEVVMDGKRLDLGFSFSNNFAGLRNYVGPILEFSIAYHLDTSPSCRLAGKTVGNSPRDCWNFITAEKAKIYENIWFRTIHK